MVKLTYIDGLRAGLHTECTYDSYWTYYSQHVAAKQALIPHSSTRAIYIQEWKGPISSLPILFTFGQYGNTAKLPRPQKLHARAEPLRYLKLTEMKHVIVQCESQDTRTIINSDLHPVHRHREPAQNHTNAHVSIKKTQYSPKNITLGIMETINLAHDERYLDHKLCNLVHDAALVKVDTLEENIWNPKHFVG